MSLRSTVWSLNTSSELLSFNVCVGVCVCVCFAFNSTLSDSWHLDKSTRCWRWSLFPQTNHHKNTPGLIKKVCIPVLLPVCLSTSTYLSVFGCLFMLSVCMYLFYTLCEGRSFWVCQRYWLQFSESHMTWPLVFLHASADSTVNTADLLNITKTMKYDVFLIFSPLFCCTFFQCQFQLSLVNLQMLLYWDVSVFVHTRESWHLSRKTDLSLYGPSWV